VQISTCMPGLLVDNSDQLPRPIRSVLHKDRRKLPLPRKLEDDLLGPTPPWPQRDSGLAQGKRHGVSGDTEVIGQFGQRLTSETEPSCFLGLIRT